jgi:hypothetical protein
MNSRAIAVVYQDNGHHAWIYDRCRESIEQYASHVKADLITRRIHGEARFLDKYSLAHELYRSGYDRMLQLDADVFIRTEEDIFDAYPDAAYAAHLTKQGSRWEVWDGTFPDFSYNSGVVVTSPKLMVAFDCFVRAFCVDDRQNDENIINPFLNFAKVTPTLLADRFNTWTHPQNTAIKPESRGFFHFANALDNKYQRWEWFAREILKETP